MEWRPRRAGAVGEYRRPRRVHHLLARRLEPMVEPNQLDRGAPLGPRWKGAEEQPRAKPPPPTVRPHVERPGPAEFRDPVVRRELQKATVWLGVALAIAGIIVLAKPLLLSGGGAILSVFLDGGVRLLGLYLPIPRGWRLLLLLLLGFGFLVWVIWFA